MNRTLLYFQSIDRLAKMAKTGDVIGREAGPDAQESGRSLMVSKNLRRQERIPSHERVAIGWDDSVGQPRFVFANCLNITTGGLSLQVNQPLAVRTYVTLRSEKLKLAVTATVKYCVRRNSWYQVGFEFTPGRVFNNAPALAFG